MNFGLDMSGETSSTAGGGAKVGDNSYSVDTSSRIDMSGANIDTSTRIGLQGEDLYFTMGAVDNIATKAFGGLNNALTAITSVVSNNTLSETSAAQKEIALAKIGAESSVGNSITKILQQNAILIIGSIGIVVLWLLNKKR